MSTTPHASTTSRGNSVKLLSHPLVLHKLSIMRDVNTKSVQFRDLMKELTQIIGVLSSQTLDLCSTVKKSSPEGEYVGVELKDKIGLFPILRSGLAMTDAMLELMPKSRVYHLGLYREKSTLQPVEYYSKLPSECAIDLGIILDPMIATAGTAIAAVNMLKDWGLKRIKIICILASESGINVLRQAHPDVQIYVGQIDPILNDAGYIEPGLGDAGDRMFRTMAM